MRQQLDEERDAVGAHRLVGSDIQRCVLYGATEPLDNPDYERYLRAFHATFGVTPQTTTAAWQRDIERTRRMLALSRENAGVGDRLTINTLGQLRTCLAAFTPAELADVELVLQHPEAQPTRAAMGRSLADPDAVVTTLACVTGFVVNLVERSVQLVSPWLDPVRWPLGHAVFRRGRFEDARALRELLAGWAREVMRDEIDDTTVLGLRDDLEVDGSSPDLVVLVGRWSRHTIRQAADQAILRAVDGRRTVAEIVAALTDEHGAARLYQGMWRLHGWGVFADGVVFDG